MPRWQDTQDTQDTRWDLWPKPPRITIKVASRRHGLRVSSLRCGPLHDGLPSHTIAPGGGGYRLVALSQWPKIGLDGKSYLPPAPRPESQPAEVWHV